MVEVIDVTDLAQTVRLVWVGRVICGSRRVIKIAYECRPDLPPIS